MELTPVSQRFILHWGEMGARWGINRTVAQIHALLFLSPKPLDAEEIAETLGVARSNVSNSLKELQGWGIVRNRSDASHASRMRRGGEEKWPGRRSHEATAGRHARFF